APRFQLEPGFFFFKQKTAYDISTLLEFSRVLFRSDRNRPSRYSSERRPGGRGDARNCSGRAGFGPSQSRADSTTAGRRATSRARSEERRVGKECTCGCAAYDESAQR